MWGKVIDVFCGKQTVASETARKFPKQEDVFYVVADVDGKRHYRTYPFELYYERATPNPAGDVPYFYFYGSRCTVTRTYVTSRKDWRAAEEEALAAADNSYNMVNLRPEIAFMVQNDVRLGDLVNVETGAFMKGDDAFVPQRLLVFDLETTTLDPHAPNARILTIGIITAIVRATTIDVQGQMVGQLGDVDVGAAYFDSHKERWPNVPLQVIPFYCNVNDEASVASAEKRLIEWFSHIVHEFDPDAISVRIDFFLFLLFSSFLAPKRCACNCGRSIPAAGHSSSSCT